MLAGSRSSGTLLRSDGGGAQDAGGVENPAAFNHPVDFPGVPDVRQGIGVDRDEIGELARAVFSSVGSRLCRPIGSASRK